MANETGVLLQERRAGAAPSTGIHSRFVVAGGIKTHFLEAGSGFPVVLLHSGEFGGCAELSWEYTIGSLAERFRVIAADWAGFGKTEKVFSFDDTWGFRIRHMTASSRSWALRAPISLATRWAERYCCRRWHRSRPMASQKGGRRFWRWRHP